MDNIDALSEACNSLSAGDKEKAGNIIATSYPHTVQDKASRKYTELECTQLFIRDGFIDRYPGQKLLFPPVLRLLSTLLPDAIPFHKNWKMSECHIAYWQLFPTVDHLIPVARGGEDIEANWYTTSMMRNSAKSNWLLEEIDWNLHAPGKMTDWDGQLAWFMAYIDKHPVHLDNPYIKRWHKAALASRIQ